MKMALALPAAALTVMCAVSGATEHGDALKRYPIPARSIRPEIGHCYIANMDFGEDGDKESGNKSGLLLFEDGEPLGPARSVHKDIREKGQGPLLALDAAWPLLVCV